MKKSYLMMAAAAALFAACSSNDLAEEKSPQTTQPTDNGAVVFDSYVSRGTTRGGFTGSLTAGNITGSTAGFGVFGYYTNNVLYGQTAIPDFFYNQMVTHNGSSWTYSPIKYWPNEFGTSAESTGQDKLTFFAYAPYVEVNPGTGRMANKADEQYGIVGMTSNNTSGDPYVKYIASFDPDTRVDLCYGVANSDFKSSVDGNNNNVLQGKPYIDVIKPKINDKIYFNFKHALASLNVTIDADIDELSHGTTDYLATNATKIYVRKVTFEGFADKGSLNLNSEATSENYAPNWFELNSINRRLSSGTVTIYDGRRDGREGQANATASNETPNNLKSSIIEDEGATTAGVPVTPVNLFDSGTLDAPIFVIPTDENLKVTIVYDVETADDNLSTYLSDGTTKGSSVENTITKTITYNSGSALKLQAGKAYKVSLHLGMTSVKFDATVTDWPTDIDADNTDLPINAPSASATAASTPTPVDITIPASATNGVFAVDGLAAGASATATTFTGLTFTPATGEIIGSDGKLNVNYNVPANTTVSKKTGNITVTENGNAKSAVLNLTQQPASLGLTITTPAKAGLTEIALDASAVMAAADWTTNANYTVVRKRAGFTKTLTKNATPGADTYDVASVGSGVVTGKITLGAAAQAGDVYTITIQAGDAAAETVSFTVVKQDGTLSAFSSSNVDFKDDDYVDASTAIGGTQTTTRTGDGVITYSIARTSGTGANATIDGSGAVKFAVRPTVGDQYTVTATVADGANYTYATNTTTYTITIVD